MNRFIISLIVVILGIAGVVVGQPKDTQVSVEAGASSEDSEILEGKIKDLLQAVNTMQAGEEYEFPDEPGVDQLREIISEYNLISTRELLEVSVVQIEDDQFEIPGLYLQEEDGNIYEYDELVFIFDASHELQSVRMASDTENFGYVLDRALEADEEETEEILEFTSEFIERLTEGDQEYLRNAFEEDARIITGSEGEDYTRLSLTNPEEYVDRLTETIYDADVDLSISLSDKTVFRHPDEVGVFGVVGFQQWDTPLYSDEGYLYLTIDKRGDDPVIPVRTWQEMPFESGRHDNIPTDPQPISLNLAGYDAPTESGDIELSRELEADEGILSFMIDTDDDDLLNSDILRQWIDDEIIRFTNIIVDTDELSIYDDGVVRIPFESDEPVDDHVVETGIEIRETALLYGDNLKTQLFLQFDNTFDLNVEDEKEDDEETEEEEEPEPPRPQYAELDLSFNTDSVSYQIETESGREIRAGEVSDQSALVILPEGTYTLLFDKEDYESKSKTVDLYAEGTYEKQIDMEKTEVEEEESPGFVSRNRYWIMAGSVAVIGSAVAIISGGGSEDSDWLPDPPGNP